MIKEKKHRLEREFYQGEITTSFTICVEYRKKLFTKDFVFNVFEKILLEELSKQKFDAHVYLFMPDHLHMIVTGRESEYNSLDLMKLFKQKSGFWLSGNLDVYRWQKDFYDHIIRDENDIKNQIYYILENPVRAGLVKHWKEYPYKGSTVYNLDELD